MWPVHMHHCITLLSTNSHYDLCCTGAIHTAEIMLVLVQASEAFLQRMVALLVASHYRNTPNDLMMMADAPAHHLFVLLGPLDETVNALPDILAVVQVGLLHSFEVESWLSYRNDSPLLCWQSLQQCRRVL